ncbi:hypothetical protein GGR57DRAFT_455351 [Xylariaceae sp. FL1272]|nr:hypothetical protein GGR57DRAFT_455351 [Xylariaceae sp. FL1272]
MVLEEVFEAPRRNNYEEWAKRIAELIPSDPQTLKETGHRAPSRPLSLYRGTYRSMRFDIMLQIDASSQDLADVQDKDLTLSVISVSIGTYTLKHRNKDTWTWWMSHDESVERARSIHILDPRYYSISFEDCDGVLDRIVWRCPSEHGTGSETLFFYKDVRHSDSWYSKVSKLVLGEETRSLGANSVTAAFISRW